MDNCLLAGTATSIHRRTHRIANIFSKLGSGSLCSSIQSIDGYIASLLGVGGWNITSLTDVDELSHQSVRLTNTTFGHLYSAYRSIVIMRWPHSAITGDKSFGPHRWNHVDSWTHSAFWLSCLTGKLQIILTQAANQMEK